MAMSWGSRTSTRRARTCRSTSSPSCQTPSSAVTVAEIDDLLTQILSHLPIKALLRYKCVSKRWLSLITNPSFAYRIISSKPSTTVSGLFSPRNLHSFAATEYEFIDLRSDDDENSVSARRSVAPPFKSHLRLADHPSDMIILQSCNGLLLCQCSCPYNHYTRNYYVYNPTTKQSTLLPPINASSERVLAISLAFDPSKSPHYKAVCIRTCDRCSSDLRQIEVYSSNAGPWRVSGSPFTLPSATAFGKTVFWNNAVHWFGDWGDCVVFDIQQEEIKILPLPHHESEDEWETTRPVRFLDECRGHLYFVEVYDPSPPQFSVYEMESDGSGWSPKYKVDLKHLAATFPEMIRTEFHNYASAFAFSVMSIVREETEDESYIVLHIPDKVVRYNFKDKTSKKLRDYRLSEEHDDDNSEFYGIHQSFRFVESLACV